MSRSESTSDVWRERRYRSSENRRPFGGVSDDVPFQRDRARVIHASAFRSLQGKTQIHHPGDGDFYRTRLTHSLEVAQIASGICEHLKAAHADDQAILDWIPAMSLIEAVGLSHDIGHPPFGHGGEVALNYHLWNKGGFEGNGQTHRIVSCLGEYSPKEGLNLTRRAMLGVLKYPALHRDLAHYPDKAPQGRGVPLNLSAWRPPKCVLDDDEAAFEWVLSPLSRDDRRRLTTPFETGGRHRETRHNSFDASIMNLADDIAYGVHDFEDALALRLITFREWQDVVAEAVADIGAGELHGNLDFYGRHLFSRDDTERKHAVSRLVHHFISNITVETDDAFETPLLRLQARIGDPAGRELALLKDFIFKYVIRSPEVQAAEFRGQQMLLKLFEVLYQNPDRLLPDRVFARFEQSANPARVVADYLAAMTDARAAKHYQNLFSPAMGTIVDPS